MQALAASALISPRPMTNIPPWLVFQHWQTPPCHCHQGNHLKLCTRAASMYSILNAVCCAPLQRFVRRVLSMRRIEYTDWDGLVCVSSSTCICWMDLYISGLGQVGCRTLWHGCSWPCTDAPCEYTPPPLFLMCLHSQHW